MTEEEKIDEKKRKNADSILVVCAALLICISGFASLKLPSLPLPLGLQNFAVVLAAAALGGSRAAGAAGLFLTIGALGVPVFNGRSGILYLTQTFEGSFILGYFIAALVVGFYLGVPKREEPVPLKKLAITCVLGFLAAYIPPVMSLFSGGANSFADFAPFLPVYLAGDLAKCAAAIPLARILRNKFAKE